MSDLTPETVAGLRARVTADRVVLFMKGTRDAPRCGFSARVVAALDDLLDDYATWDVLADDDLREDLKAWSGWPTYPQLWVDGELVGGADIVTELAERGELAAAVGAPVRTTEPPRVTIDDAARARLLAALDGADADLRLIIDRDFTYRFEIVAASRPTDVQVTANGIRLVFDPGSARRADGLQIEATPGSPRLVIRNPNEPARVQPLGPEEYALWRDAGRPHVLLDVRTPQEWALAHLDGALLVGDVRTADLRELDHDGAVVVICHHGVRSHHAAQHLLRVGFREVYNLTGGIDAWSVEVDPTIPRY